MLVIGAGWWTTQADTDAAAQPRDAEVSAATIQQATDENEELAYADEQLTEKEAEAVRTWLSKQERPADETEENGKVYLLTEEEAAALSEALPELSLPEKAFSLYLPDNK